MIKSANGNWNRRTPSRGDINLEEKTLKMELRALGVRPSNLMTMGAREMHMRQARN